MNRILPALCALITAASATEIKLERVPENGVQPQVTLSPDGTVHLVYLTGKPEASDIRYAKRGPKEPAWSVPLTVNSDPSSAVAVGTIRGAQIAAGRDGCIHVVWNGAARNGQHAAAPLYYAKLENGKFTAQRTLNAGTIHLDGGASVAADDKGGVFVVWHAAAPDGKSEADRRVYLCRSTDHGKTFTDAAPVKGAPPGVCSCCSLKAGVGGDGALRVVYRNVHGAKNRDMTLLESTDAGASFTMSELDSWQIAACPMSSAAMLAHGKESLWAWEEERHIGTRLSAANTAKIAVPGGRHPTLAANARGETLVAWSTGTAWQKGGRFGWALLSPKADVLHRKDAAGDLPVWGHTAAFADAAGDFVILH
jgi:hypothetical protein